MCSPLSTPTVPTSSTTPVPSSSASSARHPAAQVCGQCCRCCCRRRLLRLLRLLLLPPLLPLPLPQVPSARPAPPPPPPPRCSRAVCHGFAGYFDAKLYNDVHLSIHPPTHTPNMFSWFPIYFPLREPFYVPQGPWAFVGGPAHVHCSVYKCAQCALHPAPAHHRASHRLPAPFSCPHQARAWTWPCGAAPASTRCGTSGR